MESSSPIDDVDEYDLMTGSDVALAALAATPCNACVQPSKYAARVQGTILTYCGHHGTRFRERLEQVADMILDARHAGE